MTSIHGEIIRLRSTGLAPWSGLTAVLCGGGMTLLLALTGPQNSQPPIPDIDTPDGVGVILGIGTVLLFVPALIGTVAVTSEYRHRTIGTTFLIIPRRGRVLGAKVAVYAALGVAHGVVLALSALLGLVLAAHLRGMALGVAPVELTTALVQLALAAAAYMVLGVGIGALSRSSLVAIGVVIGYFMFAEYLLMLIPGINALYPFLPGGATAALTRFGFLADAVASQTALAPVSALPPMVGGLILVGYAVVAAVVAVVAPLRRDLT